MSNFFKPSFRPSFSSPFASSSSSNRQPSLPASPDFFSISQIHLEPPATQFSSQLNDSSDDFSPLGTEIQSQSSQNSSSTQNSKIAFERIDWHDLSLAELTSQVSKVRCDITDVRNDITDARSELQSQIDCFQADEYERDTRMNDLEASVIKFNDKLNRINKDLGDFGSQVNGFDKDQKLTKGEIEKAMKELQEKIEVVEGAIKDCKDTRVNVDLVRNTLKAEIERIDSKMHTAMSLIDEMTNNSSAVTTTLSLERQQLTSALHSNDNTVLKVQEEIKDLKEALHSKEAQLAQFETYHAQIKEELEQLRSQVAYMTIRSANSGAGGRELKSSTNGRRKRTAEEIDEVEPTIQKVTENSMNETSKRHRSGFSLTTAIVSLTVGAIGATAGLVALYGGEN